VVFLYHAFNRGAQPLSVRTRDFDAQLAWLEDNRVDVVSTSELLDFLEGQRALPARVAVIHIDDGLASVYSKAWPILKHRNVRFSVGIPTGMLEDPKNAPVMTWEHVREMVASGLCEVASHGHMHRRLVGLTGKRQWEELELSRDLIRERIGAPPVAYFYPLGAYDSLAASAAARAGYRAAFRATGAPIAAGAGSAFWLPRVSIFHGESAGVLSHYFGPKFLGQVRYSQKHDLGG
jgi:peptidoglycan/xylan/chitin deacetylase (PgdA/CDA1 family)